MEAIRKSQKLFPFAKKGKRLGVYPYTLTLLHSERPKLYAILASLSAIGLTHCYMLDKSICHFEGVRLTLSLLFYF